MSTVWRVVLIGPADLERSIIDSALRQAGFELAVPNHLADLADALGADGVHAVLVCGDHLGREKEKIDWISDVREPVERQGIALIHLVDDDSIGSDEKTHLLERPLRFPAAAASISTIIEAHQESILSKVKQLDSGGLRHDITRIASSSLSGVIVIDTPETPGQIHVRSGQIGLVVCGGLIGAEALSVLLGMREGNYRFDRQQATQGEELRPVVSIIAEADALELRSAEMMIRAPQGALEPDPKRLLQRLSVLSDDISWIFRLIDGKRDIKALWMMGGSRAVEGVLSLVEDGILVVQRGSSRVLEGIASPETDRVEPDDELEPQTPSLEDDFAWSLAVKGVSGLPNTSLKEERWEQLDRDWDQLPDLDLGIEDALSAAQNYFKTQAPDVDASGGVGIEPVLDPQAVSAVDEFDPPPILEDNDVFADGDEIPPVVDEFLDDESAPPVQSFNEHLPPYQAPATYQESQKPPFTTASGGSFGHEDQITSAPELAEDEREPSSVQWMVKRFRFAVISTAIFGLAAFTTYKHSQRIKETTQGDYAGAEKLVPDVPAEPPVKPPVEPSNQEPPEQKAPELQPRQTASSKVKKKRRRRRRRVRRASRRRLRQGEFAKRMQGARMLRDDGNLEGAIELISLGLKLDISSAERSIALSERGEAHFSAGSPNKAKSDLRSAIAADATNSFALKTLGLIEYQSFKSGNEAARVRARSLLDKYREIAGRRDAAVERWLAELE